MKLTPLSFLTGITLFLIAEIAPYCYWSQIELIAWAIKDYPSYIGFFIIYPIAMGTATLGITLAINKFQT